MAQASNQTIDLDLARRLAGELMAHKQRLITVESCTGGMVAAYLTSLPGSSDWLEGAFVTYRLSAKQRMVAVNESTLERYGAVSEPTAREMAEGALHNSDADISVAITGVAGPGGGDIITPVGTVWFAWAVKQADISCVQTLQSRFDGDRDQVRNQAVNVALQGVLAIY